MFPKRSARFNRTLEAAEAKGLLGGAMGNRDPGLTRFSSFYIFGIMNSKDAVESLAALAQDSRLAVYRLLVKRGPEGYAAGELGERLKIPGPTLSFHLKSLLRRAW